MKNLLFVALIVPLAFSCLGAKTRRYPYNLLTIAGMVGILFCAMRFYGAACLPLILALVISAVADYLMAHKSAEKSWYYLIGIAGFFLAHVCYLWYVTRRFEPNMAVWLVGAALVIGYGVVLGMRILPKVSGMPMKIAVAAYAGISICALALSLGLTGTLISKALFVAGIACIVFSDTIIAEVDFAGNKKPSYLIMPTYYACHLLITASVLVTIIRTP